MIKKIKIFLWTLGFVRLTNEELGISQQQCINEIKNLKKW